MNDIDGVPLILFQLVGCERHEAADAFVLKLRRTDKDQLLHATVYMAFDGFNETMQELAKEWGPR